MSGYATIFYELFQVSSNYCSFLIIKPKLLLLSVCKLHGTPHLAMYSITQMSDNITAAFIMLKLLHQTWSFSKFNIIKINYAYILQKRAFAIFYISKAIKSLV
jgi:hypothetical protein